MFQDPESRIITALDRIHHKKYGFHMHYYCHSTERDMMVKRPEWGGKWPFYSPRWEETEAAFELYESIWKYYFLVHIASLDDLRIIVQNPSHTIDPKSVDMKFAVDWHPPEDPYYRQNFIEKIRELAYRAVIDETKGDKPWYGDKPLSMVDTDPSVIDAPAREWFTYAREKWSHRLNGCMTHLIHTS